MVMKLTSGSQHKLRQALWAPVYADVLEILNGIANGHTLMALGDDYHGKLNASTFTGRKWHADGIEGTITPSEALSAWDTPVTYEGPRSIPVLTYNGSDEYAIHADDTLFFRDDAGGANSMSMGMWVNLANLTAGGMGFLSKRSGDGEWEWTTASGKPRLLLKDNSAGVTPFRLADATLSAANVWLYVAATYTGAGGGSAADGILLYENAVVVASTSTNNGSYVGMENTTEGVGIGTNDVGNGLFLEGKVAGGPLSPWFAQGVATIEELERIYQIGRAALIGA